MKLTLKKMETSDIKLVKNWLEDRDNNIWLDSIFQQEELNEAMLAIMLMKKDHRTYIIMAENEPAGIIGLTEIDDVNRSANLWNVLGNKAYKGMGVIREAQKQILQISFTELGLHTVNAWITEGNIPAIKNVEKLGFKRAGNLRESHWINDSYKDRWLYDILKEEFIK
jgi:RimJ/RimL family protein N-acetyltransferase